MSSQEQWVTDFGYQFKPVLFYGRMRSCEVSIGKGWHQIFNAMCQEIDQLLQNNNHQDDFWWLQVKEKFGLLRAYFEFSAAEGSSVTFTDIENIVDRYEQLSAHTCERCGNPGALRTGSWIKSLCDDHADGRELL